MDVRGRTLRYFTPTQFAKDELIGPIFKIERMKCCESDTWRHEVMDSSVSAADVLKEGAPGLRQVTQVTPLRIVGKTFPVFVRQLKSEMGRC